MRSGIYTTEFWLSVASHFMGVMVIFGYVAEQDRKTLEGALSSGIASIATLISSALVVTSYLKSRTQVKLQEKAPAPGGLDLSKLASGKNSLLPLFLLAGLAGLVAGGQVMAAEPIKAGSPCFSWLPWRQEMERRLERDRERNQEGGKTDPALVAVLQRLADNQALIIKMMENRPAPAPQAIPGPLALGQTAPKEFHYFYYGPKQVLPIDGAPKQALPIDGAPKQALPIDGAPKQALPQEGGPKQALPIDGAPKQGLEGRPPAPQGGAPISYQRFTVVPTGEVIRPVWHPVKD